MALVLDDRRSRVRLLRQRLLRAVGARRRADIQYVRLLEGWLRSKAVTALYDTVRSLSGPGEIAEIGSWKGKSTTALALAARRSGRNVRVYAIDPHPVRTSQANLAADGPQTSWPYFLETLRDAGVEDVVEPLRMGSREGARLLAARGVRLALLFVDGEHDEASVTRDVEVFLPLLLPGAWIALDDARPGGKWPGVYRAFQAVLAGRTTPPSWAGSLLLARLREEAAPPADPSG